MKQSKWRAWLPAIGFALAVHILIIGIFVLSKDDNTLLSNTDTSNITSTNTQGAISNETTSTRPSNDDYQLDNTNAQLNIHTPSDNNERSSFDITSEDSPEILITNSSIRVKPSEHDNVNSEQLQLEPQRYQSEAIQSADATPNALDNDDYKASSTEGLVNPQTSTHSVDTTFSPSVEHEILTERDVPKQQLEEIFVTTDDKNAEIEQTEILNDKLSSVIAEVRARNDQKIQQQQQSARQAQQSIIESQQQTIQEVTEQLGIEEAAEAEFGQILSSTDVATKVDTED